jgi:hypothetical protein
MSIPHSTEVALWRLTPNGALDSEFGVDGQITFLRTEGFTFDTMSDLLAQEHGLVAALAIQDMPSEFVVLRFRT